LTRSTAPSDGSPTRGPNFRINDGKCDRAGRFWSGTVDTATFGAHGALYRLDPDHTSHRVAGSFVTPNGIAFSPDDRLMYWSDSRRGRVFAFDYDLETGNAWNRRLWLETDDSLGRPDGAAVDVDGCYWSARFAGGRVIRFRPDGRIDREIRLPVSQVTMCAFGGADLRTLFITTAREGLDAATLARQPLAGGLFAVDAGSQGLPEPRFND